MTTKVTPTGTIDWYIKWVASILILIALSLRASGFSVLLDIALEFYRYTDVAYSCLYVERQGFDCCEHCGTVPFTCVGTEILAVVQKYFGEKSERVHVSA